MHFTLREEEQYIRSLVYVCVCVLCVCVRACARARARVCVCVCVCACMRNIYIYNEVTTKVMIDNDVIYKAV